MKVLVFSDGKKAEVTGEVGKFWITKRAWFRKTNPDIVKVIDEPDKDKDTDEPKSKKECKSQTRRKALQQKESDD